MVRPSFFKAATSVSHFKVRVRAHVPNFAGRIQPSNGSEKWIPQLVHTDTEEPLQRSGLLGFVVMFHSDDYIPLLVSFIDIPVSLDNLLQRIASIDDRFYLPRLNQLPEEN